MHPEARLLKIALAQHSVFTYAQARRAGIGRGAIDRRSAEGRWRRLHRGVYVLAGVPITWEQRITASLLACGPIAVASYDSALVIWDLVAGLAVPHVTVPAHLVRRPSDVIVHRSARLDASTHRGFRVTSPMRTALDAAGFLPEEEVEVMIDALHGRRLLHPVRFDRYLAHPANLARPGSGALRRMVRLRDADSPISSKGETLLFRLLRTHGLPRPIPQFKVETRTGVRYLDFAYPDRMLAIEIDGYAIHSGRRVFEDDRVRQNELEALGWGFRRFTWRQITSEHLAIVVSIGEALGLVPRKWSATTSRA